MPERASLASEYQISRLRRSDHGIGLAQEGSAVDGTLSREVLMKRILVIDQDRTVTRRLGLACLERGVGVIVADTVCEAVRVLLTEEVSLIVVDAALVRLPAREQARLFDRVAPGVPVVVVVRSEASLDTKVAFEVAGFPVMTRPVTPEDLLEKDEHVLAQEIAR